MNKFLRSSAIVLSMALLVVGSAGVSRAQAAQESSADQQSANGHESGKKARTGRGEKVEQVVVTARRRKEFLENVPIAISAISGDQAKLRGIDSTTDLVMSTPGLQFDQEASFSGTPFLRGVGSLSANAGNESPVAVYVDGVYYASPNGNLLDLSDIDSVQVLYGPQGTLFGRNATAGVIQIKTKDPSFQSSGNVSVGYGNYDTFKGSFYGTTALSDNVAVNLAVQGSRQGTGFGHSLVTGRQVNKSWNFSARAKLLANLGHSTTMLLAVDYSQMKSDMGSNLNIFPGTIGIDGTTFAGDYNTNTLGKDYSYIVNDGVSLHIDHEMSFADLVSISAYRYTGMKTNYDQDLAPVNLVYLGIKSPTRTFSQELRLVSKADSPLKWVIGGFYLYDDSEYDPAKLLGLAFAPFDYLRFKSVQTLNSFAGFAEGTYEILPQTNLTLGIRYTKDFYKFRSEGQYLVGGGLPTTLLPGSMYKTKSDFPKVTYRVMLDHHFASNVMGYFSYSRGFNSGGYTLADPGTAGTQAPLRPQVLDSYEIGLKSTLLDGRLTFNASGYYYDYSNLVVQIIRNSTGKLINAAAAEIKGVQADFTARPFDGFVITGGFNFNDSKFTTFPNGPVFIPNPPFGNIETAANLAGKSTEDAPRYTVNFAPSYSFDVDSGIVTLTASYYYNSGYYGDPANQLHQKAYSLVNASLDYNWNEGLDVRLWVKNLGDTHRYLFFAPGTLANETSFAPPRLFGITLSKDF